MIWECISRIEQKGQKQKGEFWKQEILPFALLLIAGRFIRR
jgi:hypothetical protein